MIPPKRAVTAFGLALLLITAMAADNASETKLPLKPYPLDACFVSGKDFPEDLVEFEHGGRHLKLCCEDCEGDFEKDPKFYLAKLERLEKELAAAKLKVKSIDVTEFEKLRTRTNSVVLDVRPAKEFGAAHMPTAIHLDVSEHDFAKKASSLDKAKAYLVYCEVGVRSVQACSTLSTLGFTNVFHLQEGYAAWRKLGGKEKP